MSPTRFGGGNPSGEPIFVLQKHAARALHYDFRLEIAGVLKSWALPKGPSTDPRVKRLAVPTEDHPLEYAHFEGRISEEHYGAGTVLVWDLGTYRNLKEENGSIVSMENSLRQGHVVVSLNGKKLKGGYALIRTGASGKGNELWLLIKMNDSDADPKRDLLEEEPDSVLTGRTIQDIEKEQRTK